MPRLAQLGKYRRASDKGSRAAESIVRMLFLRVCAIRHVYVYISARLFLVKIYYLSNSEAYNLQA